MPHKGKRIMNSLEDIYNRLAKMKDECDASRRRHERVEETLNEMKQNLERLKTSLQETRYQLFLDVESETE